MTNLGYNLKGLYILHRSSDFPSRDTPTLTIYNSSQKATCCFISPCSFREMLKQCVVLIAEYIPIKDIQFENTEQRLFFNLKENKGWI